MDRAPRIISPTRRNVFIEVAKRHPAAVDERVRARLSVVAGDMFVDVPAADTYVVKTLMHAEGGRILGVDNVLPPPMGDTGASGAKLLDMLMMLSLPGKERTEAEWHALYAAAGLRVASVTPIHPRSVESIIEGIPT